jgi:hypothetical protein
VSMEFSVVLRNAINLTDVQTTVCSVLTELLNLANSPTVEIKEQDAVTQNTLGDLGDHATFRIDLVAEAQTVVLDLPHDDSIPLSTVATAVISPGAVRTEESCALVIALAIATAAAAQANVIDDAQLLSASPEADPKRLLGELKLGGKKKGLSEASDELVKSLDL